MEKQDKICLLLSMQERPEQYTDEQLHQMIADDPELAEQLEQLALTKQAFVKQEADEEAIPVEDEWQKFAVEHSEEIDTLGEDKIQTATIKKLMGRLPYKIAASIIGILFTAGVTFAAIHIIRHVVGGNLKSPTQEVRISNSHQPPSALPADNIKMDTTTNTKPIVFDNVTLEKMLSQIATYYHKEVEFQNEDARQLRFYFVWKPDEGLDVTLHRLNLFESVNVELKSDKIVVE